MLRTNSKIYKERIKSYIYSCIYSEDVNLSDNDKIPHLMQRFKNEYEYANNLKRYPNQQERLKQYLMGLPFNFDFENYKILQVAENLHGCKLTEKQQDVILSNWWNHLSYHILKLA